MSNSTSTVTTGQAILAAESGNLTVDLPGDLSIAISIAGIVIHLYVQFTYWALMRVYQRRAFERTTCRILAAVSFASIIKLCGQILSYVVPREACHWGTTTYMVGTMMSNSFTLVFAADFLHIFYSLPNYSRTWVLVAAGCISVVMAIVPLTLDLYGFSTIHQRCWLTDGPFNPLYIMVYSRMYRRNCQWAYSQKKQRWSVRTWQLTAAAFSLFLVALIVTSVLKLGITAVLISKMTQLRKSGILFGTKTTNKVAKRAQYQLLTLSIGYFILPLCTQLLAGTLEIKARLAIPGSMWILMVRFLNPVNFTLRASISMLTEPLLTSLPTQTIEVLRGAQSLAAALLYLTDMSMKLLLQKLSKEAYRNSRAIVPSTCTTPTVRWGANMPRSTKGSVVQSISTRRPSGATSLGASSRLVSPRVPQLPLKARKPFGRSGSREALLSPVAETSRARSEAQLLKVPSEAGSSQTSDGGSTVDFNVPEKAEPNVGNGLRPISFYTDKILPWQESPLMESNEE